MPDGKVVTFYSYKGGTGRSMALANVAWILASAGKRVLMVDWDLEAPGLNRYFVPFLADPELTRSDGIIDLVIDYAVEAAQAMPASSKGSSHKRPKTSRPWYASRANILRFATPILWEFPAGGRIDFVPSGRQGPSYATRVNSFEWHVFYERLQGGAFLDAVMASMRSRYEYVLIDSRTGVSDTSGICTIQMPDTLVACFTLNNQSVDGVAAVASSAISQRSSQGARPLHVWPVPTRIELAEKERLDAARNRARALFDPLLRRLDLNAREEYWEAVEVLYQPFYAYEEVLAVFGDQPGQSHSMLSSMEKLTGFLTGNTVHSLEPIPETLRRDTLARFGRRSSSQLEAILSSFASQYEEIRRVMKSGLERTRRMSQLISRIQAMASDIDPATPESLFECNTDGTRMVALALVEFAPLPKHIRLAIEAIRGMRSAFEQYHALRIAGLLASQIDEVARQELLAVLQGQVGKTILSKDRDRWHLAQELISGLTSAVTLAARSAEVTIALKVYDNGDHTCLVWQLADGKPLANCRGFAIRRIHNGKEDYLHGPVGFSEDDRFNPKNAWRFPLQRLMWWDYSVKPGDTVQYSVVPVVGPNKDQLTLDTKNASPLSSEATITVQSTEHLSAYFNKGIIGSQWAGRALAATPQGSRVTDVIRTVNSPLRNALSGLLRLQVLSLLAAVKKNSGKIFAALFRLDDPELISGLAALGGNCNLILGNGAPGGKKPENNDENEAVRTQLKLKINVFDRLVKTPHFAQNNFAVFCDSKGSPQRVLSGSTDWTCAGLCMQANNALLVEDPVVAAEFMDAWKRLKAAGGDYPPELVDGNSTSKTFVVDSCKVTPWFAKTSNAQELSNARKLVGAAKEGILFLFSNPGAFQEDQQKWSLLQSILNRHQENDAGYNPKLYIRGIVSQDAGRFDDASATLDPSAPSATPVALFTSGKKSPQRLTVDVLLPSAVKELFSGWGAEAWDPNMMSVRSNVVVLDPFGGNPVVITGSHNMAFKASTEDDGNLIVIEGNSPLAAAYAINIIATFQAYRWNSYVEAHRKDPKFWHGLADNDQWQASYLQGDELAEIEFWMGKKAGRVLSATAGAPAAPSSRQAAHPGSTRAPAPHQSRRPASSAVKRASAPHKAAVKRKKK